ncbi:restriction endonuclease subunit S [Alkalicoccus luteus]|uniref:Restriction endonuclease subunit S n=1 Tax=Alkalicoccus luteus TaxID=1237094 RepID=A0A969PQ85_9BACI|nr:restriction endonuclease subunit S [Alkalicoccus luteus]NJP38367.1 restriction endonuclease subunit S [Alkalicoccus luteus]
MTNKLMPEIRFNGLDGEWEIYKLSSIAEFSKGRGYTKKDLTENGSKIILYGQLYTNYQTVISEVETYVESVDNSVVSQCGDVIVPSSGENSEEISRASVVYLDGVILGGDLNVIRTDQNLLSPVFLALTISNGTEQKELMKRAQGKSVVHLHNSDLKEVKVFMPKIQEQKKIGEFFKNLDDRIALQQQHITLLKETKQGFLQKMFPKDGERVPEVRFDGFSEEWALLMFGDVADIVGGGTPDTTIDEYWNGDVNWFSPAEIGKQRFVRTSRKKITNIGLEKSSAKLLPVGTVLFTSRAGIGNTAILADPASTNQGFQSIVPKKGILDSYFIYSMSNKLKKYGEINGAGGVSL